MNTPLFLAASVVSALIVLGAFSLLGFLLDPLIGGEASRRRLQRRLERRLARGEDRYFEELRSIEVALAEEPAPPFRPLGWLVRGPMAIVSAALLLLMGIFLANEVAEPLGLGTPPAWSERIYFAAFPLLGLANLLDPGSFNRTSPWPGRLTGIVFLVFGGWLLASDLSRLPS